MDSKAILLEALRLPEPERAALAGELIESLDAEVDVDAEAAWATEIHRRVEDLRAGRARTIPWAEARRRIQAAAHVGRSPRPRRRGLRTNQAPIVTCSDASLSASSTTFKLIGS